MAAEHWKCCHANSGILPAARRKTRSRWRCAVLVHIPSKFDCASRSTYAIIFHLTRGPEKLSLYIDRFLVVLMTDREFQRRFRVTSSVLVIVLSLAVAFVRLSRSYELSREQAAAHRSDLVSRALQVLRNRGQLSELYCGEKAVAVVPHTVSIPDRKDLERMAWLATMHCHGPEHDGN